MKQADGDELQRRLILSKDATYQIEEEIPSNRESPSDLLIPEHLTPVDHANKENRYASNIRGRSKKFTKQTQQ